MTATRLLSGLEARTRREVLGECLRVLRPGGRLIVADWAEQPDGIEALVTLPWRLLRRAMQVAGGIPTIPEAIEIAGFHPADLRSRFHTIVGVVDVLEAFKPLQA